MKRIAFLLFCFSFLVLDSFAQEANDDGPTMGWSSWNTYGVNISESLIRQQARAMVEKKLFDAGYKYINIDDGYFGGRDSETGHLLIHPTRFPNGLQGIVDYIHELGLKAGIYSDAGRNTCGSMFSGDPIGKGVGMYEHDQMDADFFFKDLGFDFIKIDFCGGSYYHNEDHLVLNERERYTAIAKAIKNTGRTDVRMNICRWAYPGTWASEVGFSWRTTGDISCSWESVRNIIAENLYLSAYCRNGHYNDMDMLEVGRSLTNEEDKTHFGMWCIMSSPLLIGCDMSSIKPIPLALLKNTELVALNQDPLHLQAYVCQRTDSCYVLVKDIETLNGTKRAFAVYNPSERRQNVDVDFSLMDLAGTIQLRDLFKQLDEDPVEGTFTVKVPAHGTRIYIADAETRLERTIYEAETGFNSNYQEIDWSDRCASYDEKKEASCGCKVGYLGKNDKNDLVWENVYSQNGGKYRLTLGYLSGENRSAKLTINGSQSKNLTNLNSGGFDKQGTRSVEIRLEPGMNTIRFSNSSSWMPDMDYFRLESLETNGVQNISSKDSQGNGATYDLSGRKTRPHSRQHGIYIDANHRKMLAK